MEAGAEGLKDSAFNFTANARMLEEEVRKRQRRLIILIGLVGICVVLYIVVPIILKFKKIKE